MGRLSFILIAVNLACQSTSTTNYGSIRPEGLLTSGPRTENCRDFSIDAAGGAYAVSLFPKTYNALLGNGFSLVLVSPVLLSDEILYNSGSASIIPWFNARGIPVWLVRIPAQTNLEKFGREVLPTITTAIRKNSTDADWVMAGVSLGGQSVAHYLADAPRNATVTGMQVKAAFFLGTGFDYNYPNSFGARLVQTRATELCAENFCQRYLPGVKAAHVVSRKNLFDVAGKPVWRDNFENIGLKDKGVRILFTAGKIDNVAPSESVYKLFVKTIGDANRNSPDVRFLQPGRMNRHAYDYDHAAMVKGEDLASEILPDILKWIDL